MRTLAITALVLAFTISCDKLTNDRHFTLSNARNLGMSNFNVVRIEPGDGPVDIVWRGYNHAHSDFLHVPWEELMVGNGKESYRIDDSGQGLKVNGKEFLFDMDQEVLLVRLGHGVSVVRRQPDYPLPIGGGPTALWYESTKIYDGLPPSS